MDELSKAMQESSIKWIEIASEMLAVQQLLQDIHTQDILDSTESLCTSLGIPTNFEDPIHIQRETTEDPFSQIQFCKDLKECTIPLILEELERCFNNDNVELLTEIDALDASKESFLNHQIMCPLVSRFQECLTVDVGLLKSECERASIVIKAGKGIYMNLYSNLEQLLKVSKTPPAGTAPGWRVARHIDAGENTQKTSENIIVQ